MGFSLLSKPKFASGKSIAHLQGTGRIAKQNTWHKLKTKKHCCTPYAVQLNVRFRAVYTIFTTSWQNAALCPLAYRRF